MNWQIWKNGQNESKFAETISFLFFCSLILSVLFFVPPAAADTSCREGKAADRVSVDGIPGREPAETVGECTPPKKCDTEDCIDSAPADGISRVSSRVGKRGQSSANGVKVGSTDHKGTDYAAANGSAVYAAADGKVTIVQYNCSVNEKGTVIGYGNYVVIEHDNAMFTVYAHLSGVGVSVGQTVKKGQVIGLIGNTGGSSGNHLHVEYRKGGWKGEVIDPLDDNATGYGLCTPPKEFTNKGTAQSSPQVTPGGEQSGDDSVNNKGGAYEERDTDKECSPAKFKITYEKCLFCNLFKVAFNTCSSLAKLAFDTFASPIATIVAICFALWIAFVLLTFLSSLNRSEPKSFVKQLLQQAFVVLFVYLFLKGDSASFMSIALDPIFNTGFNLARMAMGGSINCGGADGYGIITDGGLPASMGNSIICTIEAIQEKLANLLAMGTASMCAGFYTKAFMGIFPHLGYVFAGIGMWVGALVLLFVFPFLMLDSVLHMGVAAALLPAAIGAYAFKPTKNYVNRIWETFLHAMFQFVFLTIVILILCNALENIMSGAISDEEIAEGFWMTALTKMKWTGIAFLKTIFVILLGWAVLGQIASFAKSFASSISSQNEARKIGGMAASAAKGIFNKTAKPAIKKVGSDVGDLVGSAGSAAASFASKQYHNYKAGKFMDDNYRARQGIIEGTDENGNKTYTQNSKSLFLRRDKQTTLTMNGDQMVWTKEKRLSSTTVQRTQITNDVKTESIIENGNVVSEKTSFNNPRYQKLLSNEKIDLAAIEELRRNNSANTDEINKAILQQVMETRMPGVVDGHIKMQHMTEIGKVEVSTDENGLETMKMTQTDKYGNQYIYAMVTNAEGKVTTYYEKVNAMGKATRLESNGIVNKKISLTYDKNGQEIAGTRRTAYAVAKRLTRNRTSMPVDSFGHLASYMPKKRRDLGLSESEWQEFCAQYTNERQYKELAEFAD